MKNPDTSQPKDPSFESHPHADDLTERDRVDDGFCAGWGSHMHPSVRYWIDLHTHIAEDSAHAIRRATGLWHDFQWGHRLRRHVALDGTPGRFEALAEVSRRDDRLLWHCRMDWDAPDADFLRCCKDLGALGLKLHNKTLMMGNFPRETPLSEKWHGVFHAAGRLRMPVAWHVTQRRTACPYTGGGRDSYWKIGEPKGVRFSNCDLLDNFQQVVASHPETVFIGAHFYGTVFTGFFP